MTPDPRSAFETLLRDRGWARALALLPLTGHDVLRAGGLAAVLGVAARSAWIAALLGGAAVGGRALWKAGPTSPGTPTSLAGGSNRGASVEADPARDSRREEPPQGPLRAAAGEPEGGEPAAPTRGDGHAASRFDPPFRARLVDWSGAALAPEALSGLELVFEFEGPLAGALLAGVRVLVFDGTHRGSGEPLEARQGAGVPGRGATHADGRFDLEDLAPRAYTLRFLRSEPFLVLDVPAVAAGTGDLLVRAPEDLVLPRVAGRIVDLRGDARAGVQVTVMAHEHAPGVAARVTSGPSAVTDERGEFTLADVPRHGVWLDVDTRPADGQLGRSVPIDSLAVPLVGDVAVDLDCDVVARLAEGYIGARARFLDAEARPLRVARVEPFGRSFTEAVDQTGDGTFSRLEVPQRATAAELLDGEGRLLRYVPLALSPTARLELEL